jgi:RNA polymerase sigma-70 factor (ECF subfamily)
LDFGAGDSRYVNEPASDLTPERLFEREWAITLLDHVMARLRAEHEIAGKLAQFERLKHFITGRSADSSYAEAAKNLGISETAALKAASRLRQRYRAILQEEIAHTLADPSAVDEELRAMFRILSN